MVFVYTYEILNTYSITVTVTHGTADPTESPVIVEYGNDQTLAFTADTGYILSSATVDGEAGSLNDDGTYSFENVTEDHTIQVVYEPDINEDGIGDRFQVFVKFQSADETKGTVTGSGVYQVFTFVDSVLGQYVSTGDVTPTLDEVITNPEESYSLYAWFKDDETDVVIPTETLKNVPGGTTITYYAHWNYEIPASTGIRTELIPWILSFLFGMTGLAGIVLYRIQKKS